MYSSGAGQFLLGGGVYCENEQNQDLVWGAQPAPAEAFWRSVCNSGLLTAHKLPRQLRLVEPEPTRPPSRPAETGAAHPGLKTVLRRLVTANATIICRYLRFRGLSCIRGAVGRLEDAAWGGQAALRSTR